MIRRITALLPLFILSGCGLGTALQKANTEKEQYKTCILQHVKTYSSSSSVNEMTTRQATTLVISACMQQEDAYVVAMADLAMTMTANIAPREKFLHDEEAKLRGDLREIAANLVEQEL